MPYNKGKGKCITWIRDHVAYAGEGCLVFPFSRKADGRGNLGFEGKMYGAHVMMCILVHGPKPSPIHEVAHSCGNGNGGCVHPLHVSWKTPTENHQDTILHGNAQKKGRPRFKLTAGDVAEIRVLKDYLTQAERAVMFKVSNTTIAEIDRGRAWVGGPSKLGRKIPEQERPVLAKKAKQMRDDLKSIEHIANAIGVSRLTARCLISEANSSVD